MKHGADLLKLGLKEPQGQLLTVRVGGYIGGESREWKVDSSVGVRNLDGDWSYGLHGAIKSVNWSEQIKFAFYSEAVTVL